MIAYLEPKRYSSYVIYEILVYNGCDIIIPKSDFYKFLIEQNDILVSQKLDVWYFTPKSYHKIEKSWIKRNINKSWKSTDKMVGEDGKYTELAIINDYFLDCIQKNIKLNKIEIERHLKSFGYNRNISDIIEENNTVKRLINYYKENSNMLFDTKDLERFINDIDHELRIESFYNIEKTLTTIRLNDILDNKTTEIVDDLIYKVMCKIDIIDRYPVIQGDKNHIIEMVYDILNSSSIKSEIKNCLDNNSKLGHNGQDSWGEIEKQIVDLLVKYKCGFRPPEGKRDSGDCYLNYSSIGDIPFNIKLCQKTGSPNLASLPKVIKNLTDVGLYIFIFVKYDNDEVKFIIIDYYDMIDDISFNFGPQQTMLGNSFKLLEKYDNNIISVDDYDHVSNRLDLMRSEGFMNKIFAMLDYFPEDKKLEEMKKLNGLLNKELEETT